MSCQSSSRTPIATQKNLIRLSRLSRIFENLKNAIRFEVEKTLAKKPKSVNQAKGLRKQRQRGVSGCSSRKYSGIDMDMDFDLEHDEEEENDEYDDYDASEKYEYDEQDETFVDSIVALKLSPRKRADTSDSAISSVNLSESQK
ncbi:unnamed protein product [Caenorhabditis auriculariae]|uniref:Uncharacterized protein n=1 Tax=Caenorhabditis auriculariae TaxID=2777116 RepID=A0A8S1H357_9PELO|nr:unnamed protein product [Caenorhabditis auriculariae]